MIVVHCSATKLSTRYTPAALDADHRSRGWAGCGYHWYVTQDGTIYAMRDEAKQGAHVKGHNTDTIGVCYEGGLDADGNPSDTRTAAQKASLEWLLKDVVSRYSDITSIVGHRDLSPDINGDGTIEPSEWIKACPCFDAIPEYQHILER